MQGKYIDTLLVRLYILGTLPPVKGFKAQGHSFPPTRYRG